MLKTKRSITLSGSSIVDGKLAQQYQAVIDSENPEDINFSNWQTNKALYKENRTLCRADEAEFEDMAYTIQDAMIAEKKDASDATSNTETTEAVTEA